MLRKSDFYANIIFKMRNLIKQLNIYLNKFPSYERHALAKEIREAAYRVYGLVIEGDKRFSKKTTLTNLNIEHEKLRMLTFLAFELGYFAWETKKGDQRQAPKTEEVDRRFTVVSSMIDEIGKMIGGWIKFESQQS